MNFTNRNDNIIILHRTHQEHHDNYHKSSSCKTLHLSPRDITKTTIHSVHSTTEITALWFSHFILNLCRIKKSNMWSRQTVLGVTQASRASQSAVGSSASRTRVGGAVVPAPLYTTPARSHQSWKSPRSWVCWACLSRRWRRRWRMSLSPPCWLRLQIRWERRHEPYLYSQMSCNPRCNFRFLLFSLFFAGLESIANYIGMKRPLGYIPLGLTTSRTSVSSSRFCLHVLLSHK